MMMMIIIIIIIIVHILYSLFSTCVITFGSKSLIIVKVNL